MATKLPLDRALIIVLDSFTDEKTTTRDADRFVEELGLQGYQIVPKVKNVPAATKTNEAANS